MQKIKSNINISTSLGNVVKGQTGYIFNHFLNEKNRVFYPVYFNSVIVVFNCLNQPLKATIHEQQGFIYMRLVETAPHNFGKNKVYEGVLGNLVAYACKVSFAKGYDGFIAFDAKTNLISHYSKSLKAKLISGSRMFIDTEAANYLVNTYFNK